MLLRKIAPVLLLLTGACFATRNDVRLLQDDIRRMQDSLRVQAARQAQSDRALQDSLIRAQRRSSDSLMVAVQNLLNNTGGNLSSSQRGLGEQIASFGAVLQLVQQELKRMSDEQALLREKVAGVEKAFAAQDSSGMPPADGPVAKMATGRAQMAQGSFTVARNMFIQVIAEATDTLLLAEAHKELGDAYQADQKFAEADSVFKLLHEKFPTSQWAPYGLYKRAVLMVNEGKKAEAKVILNRVLNEYKTSTYVDQARELLATIGT